jgi:sarcosine oxidase
VSSTDRFDVIVIGVGAMGSAACHHLARRGQRVLGIERFSIPHELGSSHGFTRIIRLAYFEDPSYVALLRRAYVLWRELETASGERLLVQTGSVDVAEAGSWLVEGSIRSCIEHDLAHEVLDAAGLHQRFPGYRFPTGTAACFQPDGGFLLPERCVVAHAEAALRAGAELHGHEQVLEWATGSSGITVRSDRASYRCERLVVAAGAWIADLVPALAGYAVAERQVLGWFQPHRPELFQPARFPVFNAEVEEGRYYGFPVFGVPGFKLGRYHHLDQRGHPDDLRAPPGADDEAALRRFTDRYVPDAAGPTLGLRTCLFTNTADEHFVIDHHPDHREVVVASPCSGHGFKFSSVVGEIVADLSMHGRTPHDIGLFGMRRLAASEPPAAPT